MAKLLSNIWLHIDVSDLKTEKAQLVEEGKDTSRIMPQLNRLISLGNDKLQNPRNQARAAQLLDMTINLPLKKGYHYSEPSDLIGIKKLRSKKRLPKPTNPGPKAMYDKLHGAWLGRCIGCYLGKPVEGQKRHELWPFLKATGQWPLRAYIKYPDKPALKKKFKNIYNSSYIGTVPFMPIDDDTNYTTTGLMIMEQKGKSFTPEDVASFWLVNIPALATCTAERVAYRNFMAEMPPPQSALYRNPYREWIGAQIRADGFAFCAAGNPALAAELAWRDASISHIKNGIYGEMWAAACIAAAAVYDDMEVIVKAGMAQIPVSSRLYDKLDKAIEWYHEGITYDTAIERIHSIWDDTIFHDWCHTISNAVICAVALLWGKGKFGDSICKAVQPGFDTDCNGATVGSIVGMMTGERAIPAKWTGRLHDTLHTSLQGSNVVKISDMAKRTFAVYKKMSPGRP